MSLQMSFPFSMPYPYYCLPLTLISLEEWSLITIKGNDTIKYLQGQLTCDISLLNKNTFSFAAHCNAAGKTISNICIFHYADGLAYIERRSVKDHQLAELHKYSTFSKIQITENNTAILLGLAGVEAQNILKTIFKIIPDDLCPVIHHPDATILYFNLPAPRFFLILTPNKMDFLKQHITNQVLFNNSKQWLVLDIAAGYPIIDYVNSMRFIPQALNIQLLGGISFNKGCYIGQEIIARTKYYNTNKRTLCYLLGTATILPDPGESLETRTNGDWQRTGIVLAASRLIDNNVCVQAILNQNSAHENNVFRVYNDVTSSLYIHPLPYITNK